MQPHEPTHSTPPQPDPTQPPAPGPDSPPTEPAPPSYLGQHETGRPAEPGYAPPADVAPPPASPELGYRGTERQPENAVAHVDSDRPARTSDDLQAENARLRGELEDENAQLRDRLAASRAEATKAEGLTDEDVRRIERPDEFDADGRPRDLIAEGEQRELVLAGVNDGEHGSRRPDDADFDRLDVDTPYDRPGHPRG